MSTAIDWSPARDATIRQMCAKRASLDDIATTLGFHRETVRARATLIGVWPPRRPVTDVGENLLDHRRDALPPGHSETWGAITKGTVLEGMAYPYQPLGFGRAAASGRAA